MSEPQAIVGALKAPAGLDHIEVRSGLVFSTILLKTQFKSYLGIAGEGGGPILAEDIADSSAVGRSLLTGADLPTIRAALLIENVENVALSTWTGSATITTIGTLVAGEVPATLITGVLSFDNLPEAVLDSSDIGSAIQGFDPNTTLGGNSFSGGGALVKTTGATLSGTTLDDTVSLKLRSGAASYSLALAVTESLSAARTLTLKVNNANRTVDLAGNLTLAGAFATSGAYGLTFTLTGATNVTLPTSGTLATLGANTFTGNQTLNGTGNTAPNQYQPSAVVPAKALVTPEILRQLWAAGEMRFVKPSNGGGDFNFQASTTGSGGCVPNTASIYSGSTANSTSMLWSSQVSGFSIAGALCNNDFSFQAPLGFCVETVNIYCPSATGKFRLGIGKENTTTGALAHAGFCFLIEYATNNTQTVKLEVHNGTTLTTSATIATLSNFNENRRHVFTAFSDAAGNVYAMVNGTVVTVTGGPTARSGSGNQRVFFEAINGAAASDANIAIGWFWTVIKSF